MRKLFTILVLMISVVLSGTHQSLALASNSMPIAIDRPSTDIFGQDHYYSLTLRGNGDVLVSGRLLFSNTDSMPLSGYTLHIPSGKVNDITVYQVSRNRICEQYDSYDYPIYDQSYPNIKRPTPLNCIKYQEPAYYDYLSGQNTYTKATYTYENNTIDVSLPHAISSGSSGSLLLFYRLKNATTRTLLGGYTYEFQTLKTEDTVHIVQIGISTDSDLFVKGAKGKVQYSPTQYMDSAIMKNAAAGVSSPQLDMYYQQIGQGNEIKTSQALQPMDTYTVKGEYADSSWKLYGKEILIGLIIIAVCLGLVLLVIKKVAKATQGKMNNQSKSILLVGIVSTVTAACITGYTVFIYFVFSYMQFNYYSQMNTIFTILLLVVSCGVYLVLLAGPSLWIGLSRGVVYGISTCALTVFLLGVVLVILIAGMFVTRNPYPVYPIRMQPYDSTAPAPAVMEQ